MPYKDPEKQKEAQHQSYLRNKQKKKEWKAKQRKETRELVRKEMTPCVDCGSFDPRYMDWHHTDPTTKYMEVSKLICNTRQWETIKAEIDKCICLCANCHRIRHAS